MTKLQKSHVDIQTMLNDAWLGINVKENELFNPLAIIPKQFEDTPHLFLSYILSQPDYFSFLCNEILNVKILPLQGVILKTLFEYKFPMLIMTRGGSKSFMLALYAWLRALLLPGRKIVIAGSTFRQSKVIFEYMEAIWKNAPLLRDICRPFHHSGPKHDTDMWRFYIGESIVSAIPIGTGDGIRGLRANDIIADEFKCLWPQSLCETDRGLIRIKYLLDERIINRNGDYELVTDKIISPDTEVVEIVTRYGYSIKCSRKHRVLTESGWKQAQELTKEDNLVFSNQYKFPTKNIQLKSQILDKDLAWFIGISLSNLTSAANSCNIILNESNIDRYSQILKNYNLDFTREKNKLIITDDRFELLLNKCGVESLDSLSLEVPWTILQSPKDVVIEFLKGVFDKKLNTHIYGCVSETFIKDLHILLLKLNVIVTRYLKNDASQQYLLVAKDNWATIFNNIDNFSTDIKFIPVEKVVLLNISTDLYDLTTSTTHSFYADGFIQHNSHDRTIFETVIAGFGAVSSNPVENVQNIAKRKLAKQFGIKLVEDDKHHVSNQLILSGTAYYQFNHFYEYFKRWHSIIESNGDKRRFEASFGAGSFNDDINYKDYSIIRIPIELMPEGFMDQAQIARSRATMHSGNYNCEYAAVFSSDSNGFFKRSLLESCVVSEDKNITFPSCGKVFFHPSLRGNEDCTYAIGVDPASEDDNFAISIIEVWPDHKRIIYGWTITKKEQKSRLDEGDITETDFFGYCARKIRELMKTFKVNIIGIDSQGGGYALIEALGRTDNLQNGELPIYEMIDPSDPKDTDGKPGIHIIKKIQFADAKWVSEANNSLRLAFEQKTLLFPFHDSLSSSFAALSDNSFNLLYDTLEDCVQEIEELKDELSTIIMTSTDSGRDKWTTPDKKEPGMKKGKMRKDRYSALLMANSVADYYRNNEADLPVYSTLGGFSHSGKIDTKGNGYIGPDWITKSISDLYD